MDEAEHRVVQSSVPTREFSHSYLGEVVAIATFPDGRHMVAALSDGMVRTWDLKSGAILMELEGRGPAMQDLALSRDGKLIVSSDVEGYVTAWHGDTGRYLTRAFKPHSGGCSLDISPDGATLATGDSYTGDSYSAIKLWNTATWQLQESVTISSYATVSCIRYSPSGELLVVGTSDTISIYRTATSQYIANLPKIQSVTFVWTPDGRHLLSSGHNGTTISDWNTSTWKQVCDIWKGRTSDYQWRLAVNCNGTIVASPTINNCVRLWRLSDGRTIAIFQHSDFPRCIAFSVNGKYVLAGGRDKKISEWAVPKHAWPEPQDGQGAYHAQGLDADAEGYTCDEGSGSKILAMNTVVSNACISGELTTAEELLTQEIDNGKENYRSYANRSIVMARKLDWDLALDDAIKSLSIQPSLMGYISKGIALCGKRRIRDAKNAFDLTFTFIDGDSRTSHFLFLIKSLALFNANQHAEAMERVLELAAICSNADTVLTCRIIEVYLHIQLGNKALDCGNPTEAANHFTAAVDAGTFLSKSTSHPKYTEFAVLFGCDFTSLWQTANQKRCQALLHAGKLAEVFEAYRYMTDMSDEATKVSLLDWSLSFMQEVSTFQGDASKADATPEIMILRDNDDKDDSFSYTGSDVDDI